VRRKSVRHKSVRHKFERLKFVRRATYEVEERLIRVALM
jgi:hypothetical protein